MTHQSGWPHLRSPETDLVEALESGEVLSHPFVVGELACGNLGNRSAMLWLLRHLPVAPVASHLEVLMFIEGRRLMGRGIGYVDAHLLAAAVLGRAALWTTDRRLHEAAGSLGVAHGG